MKAIRFEARGPLWWEDVADVTPSSGEVVVEVAASAVNRADLLQRRGSYPPPAGESEILGLECSGTVVEIGAEVTGWAVGDEVCALLAGGGYAERVAIPTTQLLPIPSGVTLSDAAALPEAVCTVWTALRDLPAPEPGDMALVHGGSGGVGTMAIQMLRAAGWRVAATASSRHHDLCRELGAELVIDYRSEDFVELIEAATDGRGADAILDVIGGGYLRRNLKALAVDGVLTIIAVQGGEPKAEIDLLGLMGRRATVRGMTLRARPRTGRGSKQQVIAEVLSQVWPMFETRSLRPVIGARVPMRSAESAHSLMGSPEAPGGKILLTL